MTSRILIVDDEVGMQIALREVLQRQGYRLTVASDAMEALGKLESETFDLILTDVRMPEMTGLELLERVRARWPETDVLVMTAYGTIEDAVDAMKKGAADYLLKPFSSETVEEIVTRLLERRKKSCIEPPEPLEKGAKGSGGAQGSGRLQEPIAASESMQQLMALSREVADSTATILIQGESGTGKEVLARYIHHHSGRRSSNFVALNCAALPEGLLESELFGHEKGAFTGAVLARKGKFELANHGTLLLDEISEMALSLQAKLLRALQEREIDPIGSQRPVPLNVRVIATTNRNLADFTESGHFREDLYYRLQVIMLEIPPLRERREDILPLSDFFVRRLCRINRRPRKRIGNAMRRYLLERSWRGNVRELENFLERAVLLCKSDEITPDNVFLDGEYLRTPTFVKPRDLGETRAAGVGNREGESSSLPFRSGAAESRAPLRPSPISPQYGQTDRAGRPILAAGELVTLEEMERRLILKTLQEVNGNRTRAADLLGVSVRTIRNKLNLYGIGGPGSELKSSLSPAASP